MEPTPQNSNLVDMDQGGTSTPTATSQSADVSNQLITSENGTQPRQVTFCRKLSFLNQESSTSHASGETAVLCTPANNSTPKKSTGKRKGTSSSSQKKKRKQTPGSTPGSARRGNDSDDEDDADQSEYEDENASENNIQPFSIHRLQLDRLQRFSGKNNQQKLKEFELIEEIMKEVNQKYVEGEWSKYEQKIPEKKDEASFQFEVVAYIQTVEHNPPFSSVLGIKLASKVIYINELVFYYRPGEIFAITLGPTWKAIQPYSCHKFPCIISGRLTSTEGNVEETKKSLTGPVVTTKSTNKYSLLGDQLKNVRQNWKKELCKDCSLYKLRQFSSEESFRTRIQFGLAYIRILKRINLDNLPQILDHFAKICKGETTYTVHGREEKHVDDFPQLRLVSKGEESRYLEDELHKIVERFMHNTNADKISQFDFCDKHIDDYLNMETLEIIYDNGGVKDAIQVAKFHYCPSALQVFTAIRENCPDLTKGQKSTTFSNRLRNHLKVQYTVRGETTTTQRSLLDFLEGEMRMDDQDYWKIMGTWCMIRDEYYHALHKKFLDLLRRPGVLCIPSDDVHLTEKWDFKTMTNVHDYVTAYRGKRGYYPPPTEEDVISMSSQEPVTEGSSLQNASLLATEEKKRLDAKFLFDLMFIQKEKDGSISIYIHYIFDRLDGSIRGASSKIQKSLELILKDELFSKKLYNYYYERDEDFRFLFPKYDNFKHLMNGDNVHIIVAFLTHGRLKGVGVGMNRTPSKMTDFYPYETLGQSEEMPLRQSLESEKNLDLFFNVSNVQTKILGKLDNGTLAKICEELESPELDVMQLSSLFLQELSREGYCCNNETPDKPVTGKLLKLRNSKFFTLFEDRDVNKEVFKHLKTHFISQFPGFIHKLECIEIYDNISPSPRLQFKLTELQV